jgi:hypothetical protein
MAARKTATAEPGTAKAITLPKLDIGLVDITVAGETPLIVHAWSAKAKREMLDKMMGVPKPGTKPPKEPLTEFQESLYRLEDGTYGFPSVAFKSAAVTACTSVEGVTKVGARQAFRMVGEQVEIPSAFSLDGQPLMSRHDLVRIAGSEPEMREDPVRLNGVTADLRYRGQFWPWHVKLTIAYNKGVLSLDEIVNLINIAGFAVGIGEWRPEKNGQNGSFRVVTAAEAKALDDQERARLAIRSGAAASLGKRRAPRAA